MNLYKLALNFLRRDWREGEWRVLLLALVLAVSSLATVGLFADRVRQALQQQAQSLIGADLRITSTRVIPEEYRAMALARGLRTVKSLSFPSMVAHGERVVLSELLVVEPTYPLRGKITINDGLEHVAQSIPLTGTVWVDERLKRRMDLKLGDEVGIGVQQYAVAATIVKDIDQSIGFSSFAPRVTLNAADLAATGLLQEGSRVTYRLMIAGEAQNVAALRADLQSKLSGNERMEDVRDARPEIRTALERAEHFLGLAALTAAILAGAAMALAARRFVMRHLDACAVLRCLGAQQNDVLRLFLYQFLLLGLVAIFVGVVLAYATQALLVQSIAAMRAADLPQPSLMPVLKAAVSGYALLIGFAFLPLLQLRKVSPLRVLRRELGVPETRAWLVYGFAVLVLAILFLWHAGSIKLGLAVLAGLLLGLLLFGAAAWLLLRELARYAQSLSAHWRHALSNLARHGRSSALQIVALGLGGMALLVLTLVRADLMQSWQGKLPPETPNRFVINIQPDQTLAVQAFFKQHAVTPPELQPMVRGRLVAINDIAITGESYADTRARGLVEREFNLSYMQDMPSWNETVDGRWWRADERGQLSVEEGIAKTLNIHLGDMLTYDVAAHRFTAKVTHLRKVQWDSMKVNFFVITTPELLQDSPVSYLSSFYLSDEQASVGDALSREFPNLVLIDTGAVIMQVRSIMNQIAQAVSAVFLFTLLSGFVVLYAALLATQDERSQEAAILRTLGAESTYLRRLHLAEFAVLGSLSGLFAAAGAELLGWVLARFVLEIPYQTSALIWLVGCTGGMVVVMLAGISSTRRAIHRAPMELLRE